MKRHWIAIIITVIFIAFILKYVDNSIGHFIFLGIKQNDPSLNTAEFNVA